MFDDVHFYLISWVRIAKLARFLAQATKCPQIGRVLRRFHKELEEKIHLRGHLEHLEERLPGGKNASKMLMPNALLNMVKDNVSYERRLVNVGKPSVKALNEFATELQDPILFDSMASLQRNDVDRLQHLVECVARDAQFDQVKKSLAKLLRSAGMDV